jgi:hypothetical protein
MIVGREIVPTVGTVVLKRTLEHSNKRDPGKGT